VTDALLGNVQVDVKYLGEGRDIAVAKSAKDKVKALAAWKKWSAACQQYGSPTIVQLNHPGRQSPIFAGSKSLFEKNLAPSAVPLDFGPTLISRTISSLVFGTPREMTVDDIQMVVHQFGDSAKLAADSGFRGVEIHAAHGYLLGEFQSLGPTMVPFFFTKRFKYSAVSVTQGMFLRSTCSLIMNLRHELIMV
jgi:hypothetical protein